MSVDLIRYDLLVQDALRAVVRRVLTDVARDGLPGEHHLYVSFDTRAPGVKLSPRLKEKYPEEMTIVLQHQFWDLIVTEVFFEVGLSFGGIPERLHVPFDALKGFFDPSVKFGLQFEPNTPDEAAAPEDAPAPVPVSEGTVASLPLRTAPTSVPPIRPAGKEGAPAAGPRGVVSEAGSSDAARPSRKGDAGKSDAAKSDAKAGEAVKGGAAKVDAKPDAAKSETGKAPSPAKGAAETPASAEGETPPAEGGAQVVRLDSFRKK